MRPAFQSCALSALAIFLGGCSQSGDSASGPDTSDSKRGPPGALEVTSEPSGAAVYVDGEPAGETPLLLESIPSGERALLVRSEGWTDFEGSVEIVEAELTSIHVKLTYRLAGVVTDRAGGRVAGVEIRLGDGDEAAAVSDAKGAWRKEGLSGAVEVTPIKDGWEFEPPSREARGPGIGLDFMGTYRISGRVTAAGRGVAGVTITLSGKPDPVVTDRDGAWFARGLAGPVVVAARMVGWTFLPGERTVRGPEQNVDFATDPYEVSGRVLGSAGGIPGIAIAFSDGSAPAISGAGGLWRKDGLVGRVTVVPRSDDWVMEPPQIEAHGTAMDLDFTCVAYKLSGRVTHATRGVSGVSISFGKGYKAVTTDTQGRWQKSGLTGPVRVVPSREGWYFDPPWIDIDGPGAADFTARHALVINELLVRNDTLDGAGYRDEEGVKRGWFELYNAGDSDIDLGSYYASNDRSALKKWRLPSIDLEPGEFLLIWASGRDERDPDDELHANFTLMGHDALFLTDGGTGDTVDALEGIVVPVDHSYGRYPDGGGSWFFSTDPTPRDANEGDHLKKFVIAQRHVSLPAGVEVRLATVPSMDLTWSSDNPRIKVDRSGKLFASRDVTGDDAVGTVVARSPDGDYRDSCDVTVVDWTANASRLTIVDTPTIDDIVGVDGKALYFVDGKKLSKTVDGFRSVKSVGTLPKEPSWEGLVMRMTPFGKFLRMGGDIYRSPDLVTWSRTFTTRAWGRYHAFDAWYDSATRTGYLYAGDYSVDTTIEHAVYRGIVRPDGDLSWDTVLEFTSRGAWDEDQSVLTSVRHIHAVEVDPYTGHVWVGTGDSNVHARIYCSDDRGESFRLIGMGSQDWRTLSFWFTKRYVYWNMDTTASQSIWRIPRTTFTRNGRWPEITPELSSGKTKVGVQYYVTRADAASRFPVPVGSIYKEDRARSLDSGNRVRALTDDAFDYREEVARLDNGSHWFHAWVKDANGEPLVVMGAAAEGAIRDNRCRVFGIKEHADGRCDVQELLSLPSNHPDEYLKYVQLEPRFQDADGFVYFRGRDTDHGMYKTRLTWVDNE